MAATAAAMGAAAAAMRQKQQENDEQNANKSRVTNDRPETKQEREERKEMKNFEEEFMKMLTRTSLRRFAQSDGVPAADTQESILEACSGSKEGGTRLLSPAELLAELAREDEENYEEEGYDDDCEEEEYFEDGHNDQRNDDDNQDDDDDDNAHPSHPRSSKQQQQQNHPPKSFNNFNPRNLNLDVDSKFLTAEQKRLLRQEQDLRWLHAIPTRLRKWLREHTSNINNNNMSKLAAASSSLGAPPTAQKDLDIFTELVVRIPIVGAGKDEVLAFCSQFGGCEYQGPCFTSSSLNSRKKKDDDDHDESVQQKKKEKDARNEIRNFCHIVKFTSGLDAIRCFIELNGYYIDPKQYQDEINKAAVGAVKSANKKLHQQKKKNDNKNSGESLEEKMRDAEFLSGALGDLEIKSGEKFGPPEEDELARCWTSRFIFITCDFFRISFFDKAQLCDGSGEFIPRAEMTTRSPYEDLSFVNTSNNGNNAANSISKFFSSFLGSSTNNENNNKNNKNNTNSNQKNSIAAKIPSNWNPADILCKKLASRARDLMGIFPLVASHKDVEWPGMCRASNCISMFIPIINNNNNKNDNGESSCNNVWIQTLRALRGCNVNVVVLFRAIDSASSIDELLDLSFKYSFEESENERRGGMRSKKKANQVNIGNHDSDDEEENYDQNKKKKNDKTDKNQNGFWGQFSFGKFSSPDPSGQKSNRFIEKSAFVILIFLVLWTIVVFSGLLSQDKAAITHSQKILEKRKGGGV